jgi:hypothetical protein
MDWLISRFTPIGYGGVFLSIYFFFRLPHGAIISMQFVVQNFTDY